MVANRISCLLNILKYAKISPVNVVKLPSTSPIPGRYTKTFHEKVEEWRIILRYIDEK